jgi:dihydropteroate synthase
MPAYVMGILNATPDSFSDGGQFDTLDRAITHAQSMLQDGVSILDIGGESSRPGADPVAASVEIARVVPIIKAVRACSDVLISIDTVKADVAEAALGAGADIVNDISAGRNDKRMFEVVRGNQAGMVLMHMKGRPKTMQEGDLTTESIVNDVLNFFDSRINCALSNGLSESQIALDPGLGFGKTFEQNFSLCRSLRKMNMFGRPIVFGMSRKSSLGVLVDRPASERDAASLAADLWAVQQGAGVVRVHNVRQTVDALKVWHCLAVGD